MEYSTNCKIFRLFAKRRKLFTITLVIIFFAPGIYAQNVSFDANSVSVNGYYCTALGYGVLYTNTIGSNNTGTGYNALFANTIGSNNTANGYNALFANTWGNNNTAVGYNGLLTNSRGDNNTANGYNALSANTTGNANTAFGAFAGLNSKGDKNIFIGHYAGYFESAGNNKLYLANDSNKTIMYGDFSSGQVLLGMQQPAGYTFKGTRTLNVVGGIITDSVRIAPANLWADYVFADDYRLLSLEQLGQYIKTNKHLPNIPGAKEVENNGIELGSINSLLLEKIEELHLYIIQQQKQLDQQNKQMDQQGKAIGLLQQQINAIKKSSHK